MAQDRSQAELLGRHLPPSHQVLTAHPSRQGPPRSDTALKHAAGAITHILLVITMPLQLPWQPPVVQPAVLSVQAGTDTTAGYVPCCMTGVCAHAGLPPVENSYDTSLGKAAFSLADRWLDADRRGSSAGGAWQLLSSCTQHVACGLCCDDAVLVDWTAPSASGPVGLLHAAAMPMHRLRRLASQTCCYSRLAS